MREPVRVIFFRLGGMLMAALVVYAAMGVQHSRAQDAAAKSEEPLLELGPAPEPVKASDTRSGELTLPPPEGGSVMPTEKPSAPPVTPAAPPPPEVKPAVSVAPPPQALAPTTQEPPAAVTPVDVQPSPEVPAADPIVMPEAMEPPIAAPAAADLNAPEVDMVGPPVADADKTLDAEEDPDLQTTWSGNLMFAKDKMATLMRVLRAYEMQVDSTSGDRDSASEDNLADELVDKLGKAAGKQPKPEEIVKLKLNSIVYYNDADWSVWLNGQRYFRDDAIAGISINGSNFKVTEASDKEITLLWTPRSDSFSKVRKNWAAKQELEEGGQKDIQIAAEERIAVDEQKRTVVVVLRPNQTFTSKFMSVLEGQESRSMKAAEQQPATTPDGKAAPTGGAVDASAGVGTPPAFPPGVNQDKAAAQFLMQQHLKLTPQAASGANPLAPPQ